MPTKLAWTSAEPCAEHAPQVLPRTLRVFERYHPAVALCYFAAVLVLAMAAMQPVYVALSLSGALACSCALCGPRASFRMLRWQLPLLVLIAVFNPLFVSAGSTELFRIGTQAIYLESFVYGLCMGGMLVSVLLWMANAARLIAPDHMVMLLGNRLPALALVLSMVMRLVPQLMERGREISLVQDVCVLSTTTGLSARVKRVARNVTVLMGWAMEDSLEKASSMKARGWTAEGRRTMYRPVRFARGDVLAIALIAALFVGNAVLAYMACSQYVFYPAMTSLTVWLGYVPYLGLVLLPLLVGFVSEVS